MATETVVAREPDSFCSLWGYIDQLEALIRATDDEFCKDGDRFNRDQAHALVMAAQSAADLLAVAARVR